MQEFKALHSLPLEVQQKFKPYAQKLIEVHQDEVISIFIYGPATGPDFVSRKSHINSGIILKSIDFLTLKKSLPIIAQGLRHKIAAPLFLTVELLNSSLDVFPTEYLDIKENHQLVYGEDVMSSLVIQTENIRLFCEQQIKGKLIRIREAYLEVGLQPRGMEALLEDSLNALMPAFRSLLRIKNKKPSNNNVTLLEQFCEEFHLNKEALLPIHHHVSRQKRLFPAQFEPLLSSFLSELEKISDIVDRL